nr:MAG TPA: hypothetical protein [Caudoviricetes sp.]
MDIKFQLKKQKTLLYCKTYGLHIEYTDFYYRGLPLKNSHRYFLYSCGLVVQHMPHIYKHKDI